MTGDITQSWRPLGLMPIAALAFASSMDALRGHPEHVGSSILSDCRNGLAFLRSQQARHESAPQCPESK